MTGPLVKTESGDHSLRNLTEEAKHLREQGQLDEAITMLRQAISINIDDADAYFQLGLAYFDKQDYPQAKKVLRVAAGLDPANALIYYTVGRICHATGDREGVQSMQIKLFMLNPVMSQRLADDTAI